MGHPELCPPSLHHSPGQRKRNPGTGKGWCQPAAHRWEVAGSDGSQAFLPPEPAPLAPALSCSSPRSWVCSLRSAGQSQGSADAGVFLFVFFSLWKWFYSLLMTRATRNPDSLDHAALPTSPLPYACY